MRKYDECLEEANCINARFSADQVIQIANGIYLAERIDAAIKSIGGKLLNSQVWSARK